MNSIRNFSRAPIVNSLILISVLFFIAELVLSRSITTVGMDALIVLGGKFNPLIDQGEYYRFFMPIFLHSGWFHLISNMITLYFIGPIAERQFGSIRFLSIYLLSGVIGNFFSYLFTSSQLIVSVGASTAIFGVFGMLVMYGILFWDQDSVRLQTTTFIAFVVLNIITQINSPSIDVWGHIGGLVGGFLLAFLFGFKNRVDNQRIKLIQRYIAVGLLLLIFFVVYMVARP